ncbi:MAG: hypothetical protein ACOCP8_03040 [archaeon]
MLNIFESFNNSPKNIIAMQIAMLRTVSLKNRFKETGNTINRKTRKGINWALDKFGKEKRVEIPADWQMKEKLKKEMDKLNHLKKEELLRLLKDELFKKVDSKNVYDEKSLSEAIIKETAEGLELNENLSINEKAIIINNKFLEKFYSKAQNALNNSDTQEEREFDKNFNKQIDKVSDEELEHIKESLDINKVTGESIRKALTKSGGPLTFAALVQLSGIGSYIMITTVMHAIFTTMLGITLPFAAYAGATSTLSFVTGPFGFILASGFGGWQLFKGKKEIKYNLLSFIVFIGVNFSEEIIIDKDSGLPNWYETRENKMVKKYKNLKKKYSSIKNEKNKIKEKLNKVENKLNNEYKKRNKYKTKFNKAKLEIEKLEKEINNMQKKTSKFNKNDTINKENRSKKYKKKIDTLKKKKKEFLQQKSYYKKKIDKAESKISEQRNDILKYKNEKKKLKRKIQKSKEEINLIKKNDPHSALASIRIEIERKLKEIAKIYNINTNKYKGPRRLYKEIRNNHTILIKDEKQFHRILNILNKGAHAEELGEKEKKQAFKHGPEIIKKLDNRLKYIK